METMIRLECNCVQVIAIIIHTWLVSKGRDVEKDFQRTGVFVNIGAFQACRTKIEPWLDLTTLKPHLHKYGMIKGQDDLYYLGENRAPSQRKEYLINTMTQTAGSYGHHLLYMCIRDSKESRGHQDAADLLEKHSVCRH